MAIIDKKFSYGWLGSFDEGDCQPFDLSQSQNGAPIKDQIDFIFQKKHDGTGPVAYDPNADNSAFNGFNELVCGYLYEIVLKDGAAGFDIPGMVISGFYSDSSANSAYSGTPGGYIYDQAFTVNIQSVTITHS